VAFATHANIVRDTMTLAPRFLVNFWAGFRIARFARRLETAGHDITAQHSAFTHVIQQLARTWFGRQHGLGLHTNYAEFRDKVPPRHYAWFQPHIARMTAGEPDLLVPGKCPLFVETAGTSGPPKLLPVPEAMLSHFRAALRDSLFHYSLRAGHAGVFLGRQLHLGASTTVTTDPAGAYRTSFDGLLALCLSPWVDANLRALPSTIARLPEGAAKTTAAAKATRPRDVTLVGGTPAQLCELAAAVLQEYESDKSQPHGAHLQTVWPNLECCLHTGAPLGFFTEILHQAVGPTVKLHEVYAAAEGIFAAQDSGKPTAMRLITDANVFFEFLPLDSYHESTVEHAGSLCLPLKKIQPGVDYVLVVTTPAGLCRYVTSDIVRFVSVSPPRLQFVGRAGFRLDAAGERVGESEVLDALHAVCHRNSWHPIAFHVAPYEQRLGPGQVTNVHEWWLELGTHSVRTPMANILGPELDDELARRHPAYALRRKQNLLGAPQIRLVMPGVFARWAAGQPRTASLSKLPRCRPDRIIADQLAALAPFHQTVLVPAKPVGTRI
jgi:hypothetical protein